MKFGTEILLLLIHDLLFPLSLQ